MHNKSNNNNRARSFGMNSPLATGEVWVPARKPPTSRHTRWADIMTETQSTMMPTHGGGTFPAVLPGDTLDDEPQVVSLPFSTQVGESGGRGEAAEPKGGWLFPPPPPPMFKADAPSGEKERRMMRWYQAVEVWCSEPGKRDREKAIVAPPPRPPLFIGAIPPTPGIARPLPAPSPYNTERWCVRCRHWWAHVSMHFDLLRAEKMLLLPHVARAEAGTMHAAFPLPLLALERPPPAAAEATATTPQKEERASEKEEKTKK